jgi:guanylate kinase
MRRVPHLWLSRSWTTRPHRPTEPADSYVFVDRATFDRRIGEGGFLEWAEVFSGHLYGTPIPDPPPGHDVVLEIDVQGAEQVRAAHPDAVIVLLVPPTRDEQIRRLTERGDPADQVAERVAKAEREEERGRVVADHVVVNDDLSRAIDEVAGILASHRSAAGDA